MKNTYQFYRERRSALMRSMRDHAGGGLALVPTAPEVARNRDSLFPYRHDSYFYYLSGFPEPEAVVALLAGPDGEDRHVLFCREKNEEREIWDGFRYGPEAAKEIFGFDEAHPISALPAKLPEFASDRPALFTPLGLFDHWDRQVTQLLNEVRNRVRTGVSAPDEVVDVRGTLDTMRLVKDAHEVDADAARRRDLVRRAPARDGGDAPGLVRVPGRGRAAARVPAPRRAGGRVSVDRRVGPQRLRAALPRQQPPDGGGRAAADRRRLRVPGLRVGHHAHVPGQRQVHGPAEGRLRARARVAARVPRRRPAGRRLPRLPQGRRARARAGLHRPRPVQGHARRGAGDPAATSSSTCTAPATGSASTCTTPASTR